MCSFAHGAEIREMPSPEENAIILRMAHGTRNGILVIYWARHRNFAFRGAALYATASRQFIETLFTLSIRIYGTIVFIQCETHKNWIKDLIDDRSCSQRRRAVLCALSLRLRDSAMVSSEQQERTTSLNKTGECSIKNSDRMRRCPEEEMNLALHSSSTSLRSIPIFCASNNITR